MFRPDLQLFYCFAGILGARPAGFEPATRGLEVLPHTFQVVSGSIRNGLFRPNSLAMRCLMFLVVYPGWCKNWCRKLNRRHQDFQSCKTCLRWFLVVSKTAFLSPILLSYVAHCFRLFFRVTVKGTSTYLSRGGGNPVEMGLIYIMQYSLSEMG